ncbi:phosphotransferase enzyme family protein [Citreimonas sp.]|uniref:phosphotransferase enzyme family protein n=1 Tax=Citreimonas sp. TaxID=3036715 RepID=UPI0040583636
MRPPIERWGVDADLSPLAGGHRNHAFATLGVASGQVLVFKSTRRSEAALRWLDVVQNIAEDVGLVVPKLIKSRNGNLIEDGWTCEPHLAGSHVSPDEVPSVGPQIIAFHAATGDIPQRPGFLSSQDLIEQECGGDVDLRAMPGELVARCRELWSAVSGQRQAVIHGDLNPGNLIRCADGRTALIDWDECRRDLVLFDKAALGKSTAEEQSARLAWEVACSWQIEPHHARQIASRL